MSIVAHCHYACMSRKNRLQTGYNFAPFSYIVYHHPLSTKILATPLSRHIYIYRRSALYLEVESGNSFPNVHLTLIGGLAMGIKLPFKKHEVTTYEELLATSS